MKLPDCITPRPGEMVVTYTGLTKMEGEFIGYGLSDELLIKNQFGNTTFINDYLKVRPKNPLKRQSANWEQFQASGLTIEASVPEVEAFNNILETRIPPGPTYMDLITEVWSRGYEIYLVGGTVRDVINGNTANDVDLVTSMPFKLIIPLIESMYGDRNYSRSPQNGFISVACKDKYDPSIDLKNFFLFAPGTTSATFGSDLNRDYKIRDFACNSVYYDPINKFYIDPSGRGIVDSKNKIIHIVKDLTAEHPVYNKASVLLRFFKFMNRGYDYTDESLKLIQKEYIPLFSGMGHLKRISTFKTQLLKKNPIHEVDDIIQKTRMNMTNCGCEEIWMKFYDAHITELKS
ncbi:hypothetical protein [Pedobacter jeongneungensis]|uniref:hypothetical protein n=1 Tax=Pedobacter jeongneungensis TaxID=947309 RepID=UPI0004682AE7|nr:hypothetical protein [Pedobacter jeongneungensis]